MRNILRWFFSLLTALLLLAAALLGMGGYASSGWYFARALGDDALLGRQQALIDEEASLLAEHWQVSPGALSPWMTDAAATHRATLSAWWQELWHSPDGDPSLPVFLTDSEERAMISAILEDEAFLTATPSALQRATARDEVAYALDELVCRTVLPLRRSVVDLLLSAATARIDLPSALTLLLTAAGILAGLAAVLLCFLRKVAGSTLMTTGGLMVLVSVPMWLMNIPGMLSQLSPIAKAQGTQALLWLGLPWYGAALLLALLGLLIIAVNKRKRPV